MSASQVDLSLSGKSFSRQSIRKKNKGGRCDDVLNLDAKKLQSSSEGKWQCIAKGSLVKPFLKLRWVQ